MPMSLSSKELNVMKVKNIMRKLKNKKIDKSEAAKELNKRFDRMEKEDIPWFEDLFPKYVNLMKSLQDTNVS